MEEENKEIIDSTINTEEAPVEAEEVVETVEGEDETERLREQNKRLFERAKKAEERLKALKGETPQHVNNQTKQVATEQTITREELVLIAKGFDEKEIELLKVLQKGKGVSLSDAQNDEVFVAYKEKRIKEEKEKSAKLGASKSSGTKKDISIKDMSRDDHKEYFKRMSGL